MNDHAKLRYLPPSSYFFILVKYINSNPKFGPYAPWLGDVITKLEVIELTCKEHHRVKWSFDGAENEPSYDGFIFTDKDGGIWHNQYPVAHYGQLDTSADHKVASAMAPFDPTADWDDYEDIRTYLTRVANGIKVFSDDTYETKDEEEKALRPIAAEALQKHFDEIRLILEKNFGFTAVIKPRVVKAKDNDGNDQEIEVKNSSIAELVKLEQSSSEVAAS